MIFRQRKRGDARNLSNETLRLVVIEVPIDQIKISPTNARKHSDEQISQIALSIGAFGFTNPILIDEESVLIGGEGRYEAAKQLGLKSIPAIRILHLNRTQRRALAIADNKIALNATWDIETLKLELETISIDLGLDFDMETIGFSTAESDIILDSQSEQNQKSDEVPPLEKTAVSLVGDKWQLGSHLLFVGDIQDRKVLNVLMEGGKAHAVFIDPPYNVKIHGHARGLGRTRHREFAMASGEMSAEEYDAFLRETLKNIAAVSRDGSIAFICIDWRHLSQLIRVADEIYSELKNIAVWVKNNAGMGSFYRSQHEMVAIYKLGSKPHQNHFELGQHGRSRSNCWHYAGVNGFQGRRNEELNMHPTVKPVALVADAIKDVTRRGQIVLDGFAGSGTTLIAAEKTGRVARVAEIDPLYADVIIRRWQKLTGEKARLTETGESFAKVKSRRAAEKITA